VGGVSMFIGASLIDRIEKRFFLSRCETTSSLKMKTRGAVGGGEAKEEKDM